jgi:hypothetical protein
MNTPRCGIDFLRELCVNSALFAVGLRFRTDEGWDLALGTRDSRLLRILRKHLERDFLRVRRHFLVGVRGILGQ